MEYFVGILISVCIWAIAGISLNLLMGYIGLFALCHAAFVGIGAYTTAITTTSLGWNFLPALLAGMSISALLSMIIAIPSLKVHLDYFVVITLAFLFVLYHSLMNFTGLTGGSLGIKGIPPPSIFGQTLRSGFPLLILAVAFLVIVYVVASRLVNSPYGRTLKIISEDEIAAKAIGKDVTRVKVITVAISAALAAISGSLFAHLQSYIHPGDFFIEQTFLVACIVILGGFGNFKGTILAALVLVSFPELMRFSQLSANIIGVIRDFLYGLLLVLFMLFRPQGLLGKK